MPFPVLGSNSAVAAGYEIDNSYRIDDGSAVGMARFGNNSRNGNTFTISFWIKRTKLGAFQTIVTSKVEDSGVNAFLMTFQSDDTIKVQGQPASGTGAGAGRDYIQTNAVFRDPSAWYHIVYRQDTTLSTSTDRHRLYVNGVRQSTSVYNPLDQNVGDAYFYNSSSYPYAIGNDERDNNYGNFYMAEHHYTDGVSNAPTEFGETNDNGVWIPKEYTGSHGSYGHYLKFDNSSGGSGTTTIGGHDYTTGSSSTIGADSSGNGNHFHVQGYSVEDQTTDTPTNNFATMNPLANFYAEHTFSEGNCKIVTQNATGHYTYATSTMGVANGKWYAEFKASAKSGGGDWFTVGVAEAMGTASNLTLGRDTGHTSSANNGQIGYLGYSTNFVYQNDTYYATSYSTDAYGVGDIIGVALNADDNEVTFYKNGTAQNSGTAFTIGASPTGFWHFAVGDFENQNYTWECNFGNPSNSISSGNSDANGYGNFEYAPPTNYYSLCSKNLAEYG
jgi:hypothetical protein